MMRRSYRCFGDYCGAPDCRRCFPYTFTEGELDDELDDAYPDDDEDEEE